MPEFNFDFIFTGSVEEQRNKSSHFLRGIIKLVADLEAHLGESVVHGGDGEMLLAQIEKAKAAYTAFAKDPRSHALAKAVRLADQEASVKGTKEMIEKVLTEVFGPDAPKAAPPAAPEA